MQQLTKRHLYAGVAELLIFHPVDTVAKRLMSNKAKVSFSTLNGIIFRDYATVSVGRKFLSLFPGLGYAAGYKVTQRIYKFGGQPWFNDIISRNYKDHFTSVFGERNGKMMMQACAGSLTGIGEVVLLPLDALKIKRQVNPEAFRGRGVLRIFLEEGNTLYRGWGWTMARNAPGSFALFGGSALTKEYVLGVSDYSRATWTQNFIASVAGAVASIAVAAPLDVVKTRIQNANFEQKVPGWMVVKDLVRNEGPMAFFKGLTPKILVVGPKLVFSYTLAQSLIPFFGKYSRVVRLLILLDMAIDGLIILDASGRPVIQSGYTSFPPAYPLLLIDTLNNELSKASRTDSVDPVIYVPPGIGDFSGGSACCHVEMGELRLIASVSGDADPLIAFAFLQAFSEILHDYFGTVSTATLKDNFDVVYQLLEETLDSSGYPLTTSPNALRDIVLPPSLLSKLLASLPAPASSGPNRPGASSASNAPSGAFTSPIPWRKLGVRHNHNEILFDVAEQLRAIVGRNGTTLTSNVYGKIEANAKLTGMPDLLLSFSNPNVLTECAFHPCVRQVLQRWMREKTLSFVPPDGKFVLMEYQYALPHAALAGNVPVPLALKPNITVGEFGGNFTVTFSSKTNKIMENVRIELYLGESATGAQCTISSAGSGVGSVGGIEGSWTFEPQKQLLRWEIPNMHSSGSWVLRGSWTSKAKFPRPAHAFQIHFEVPSYSFSSLKVDQVRLSGETYKIYKGVRAVSSGSIEWRW
ncbi:Mu homology domain-containing protein [Boletus reticuloceps]|uniref:Mu homology domain-containing protein n=1 Tax=Boletus reticuloceps TaxID=495285 RepID=A0A8I2YNR9_9AGAM|nr:Mu homology domain-containing protein [Boletus reticuloceps]